MSAAGVLGVGTTVLGTAGSGAAASMGATDTRRGLNEYIKQQQLLQKQMGDTANKRTQGVNATFNPVTGTFADNATQYFNDLANTDYTKFNVTSPDAFKFDIGAETQAQLNPELQAIIDRSTGAVQQSAANRGGLFSGAAAKGIARSTADIQAKEWGDAATRAQQERTNKYQEYIDTFNNALKVNENNRGNISANLANKGTLFTGQGKLWSDQQGQINDINNATDTALFNSKGQVASAVSQKAGTPSGFRAFAEGAMGGFGSSAGAGANVYGAFK